jgi:hypothetical protein
MYVTVAFLEPGSKDLSCLEGIMSISIRSPLEVDIGIKAIRYEKQQY